MPLSTATGNGSLATVIDEHLRWLTQWHRAAFFGAETGMTGPDAVPMPQAFIHWMRQAKAQALTPQPAVERLIALHEQLHRLARLMLTRIHAGEILSLAGYDAVLDRFDEFIQQCRRFERAFSMAGSGIDPLTGLRNRTGMMEELVREASRFHRSGRPFCVALCDLDRFKLVNDTYGHDAGDRVLVAAAASINSGIRDMDEAFRMGGEEILILLKDAGLPEALGVLERLRQDLAALPVHLADGRVLHVTASFGAAESEAGVEPERLIERADQALYTAKHAGRNRVERWAPPATTALSA
jgi:diguanylate cyclase (GGDEF)-like protein